jgi:O-methyltransferase domain
MTTTESRPPPARLAQLPAHALRLLLLASGGRLAAIVGCLAELRVADAIADRPLPIAELADRAGAEPQALGRLLRCACAIGLLEYFAENDSVGLTGLSRGLVSDSPESILPLIRYSTAEIVAAPYRHLTDAVRSGHPAFAAAFGEPIWDYLSRDAAQGQFFDAMMSQMSGRMIGAYVRRMADPAIGTIADIGGGTGTFLRAYLAASPGARGVLVERPEVLAGAGPAERLELRAADIFTDELPGGCDAYVLMTVLHNWPEQRVRDLLRSVRRAAGPQSRLFVCEHVLADGGDWDFGRLLDIDMMLLFGGQERTGRAWQQLLAECGFEVAGGVPAAGWTVMECRPAAVPEATAPRRGPDPRPVRR